MNKTNDARELLDAILQNTHESLKWSWQIVMGFSLVVAVERCYVLVFEPAALTFVLAPHDQAISLLMFVLVFVPAFIRFFHGDNRYLDLHYLELRRVSDESDYLVDLSHLSKSRRSIDILLLLTHGIVFVFMAKAIATPGVFLLVYAALMITNSIWLFSIVRMNRRVEWSPPRTSEVKNLLVGTDRESTESPRRDRAPKFWIQNNFIALFLLLIVYVAHLQFEWFGRILFIYTAMAVCVFNSARDLWSQREFYFPRLRDIYEEAKKSSGQESSAQTKTG